MSRFLPPPHCFINVLPLFSDFHYIKKSDIILIFVLLYALCLFPVTALEFFFLSWVLRNLICCSWYSFLHVSNYKAQLFSISQGSLAFSGHLVSIGTIVSYIFFQFLVFSGKRLNSIPIIHVG